MKTLRYITDQRGFSLIEVLVGATIFIIGFTILAGSVDRALYRLPLNEDLTAVMLTESSLAEIWAGDTTTVDSVIALPKTDLRIRRTVVVDSAITRCVVVITKPRSGQEIMRTVYEMLTPQK